MKKYKLTLVKSSIKRPEIQKRNLTALGLNRLHKTVEVEATPQIEGMISKVKHLLNVEVI